MAQLLLMLIHLQQLRKLYKAIQWVTHMPIPRYEYRKCLEYSLTEESSVICGEVQGKMQGKIRKRKKYPGCQITTYVDAHTHSDGHIVKVMRLSSQH